MTHIKIYVKTSFYIVHKIIPSMRSSIEDWLENCGMNTIRYFTHFIKCKIHKIQKIL